MSGAAGRHARLSATARLVTAVAPFRTGILGMGRIAAGFDAPGDLAIRTHVKAILGEPRLQITQVADRDTTRAKAEAARFGLDAKVVLPEEILKADLDVLCIATPDGSHSDYCRALSGQVRLVLAEKPLEGDRAARAAMLSLLRSRGTTLVVHHQRRWIPNVVEWMNEAGAGGFGKPLSVVIYYTRGFRHNGIHALDLVAGFVGSEVASAGPLSDAIVDYAAADKTLSLLFTLKHPEGLVPATMFGIDGRKQTAFSVDIRFERARVSIFDEAGVCAELHRLSSVDLGDFAPELRSVSRFRDNPPRLLCDVWGNIADHLEHGKSLACADRNVLAAYDLADAIEARLPA